VTEIDTQLAANLSRRFRLVRRLGAGGMGAVFLAEQIAVGNRPVALKVLSRKLLDDPDFLLRFQNEAASTGRIHHPNVVTIYESGQADDGTPYIAMEFLEGESLRQALARRGHLPVPEVAEILQQAARGLNAAHKLGIIHRDLKPDNIFLTYPDDDSVAPAAAEVGARHGVPLRPVDGTVAVASVSPPANVVVKIVDFGIAKLRESGAHTQTGTVLGTPAYMSFEQASGMRSDELDARSDVYSLGVVVYEMLTGRPPFHSDTPVGYLRMHMQEDPPPFHNVKPDLPALPQLESVVMKALTKDRDKRYASALDFARTFGAAVVPVAAPEASQPLRSTKIVLLPSAQEAVAATPVSVNASAPPDIAVQTPAPAPPGRIAEALGAHPQGSEPVAAARPLELLKKPDPFKFVAVAAAVVFVMIIVGLVWDIIFPPGNNPHQAEARKGDVSWSAKAGESKGEVRVNPNDGLKYVWIPPGTFQMGCSPGDNECSDDEKPSHLVTITKGLWLGQTEVTVGAYKRFVAATGRPHYGDWANDRMPIEHVNWNDAHDYCTWAGGRLPTEAEWEYAARAGSTAARYGDLDEIALYADNSGRQHLDSDRIWKEDQANYAVRLKENGDGAHEVSEKRANGFGLFDMLGNVWEWVGDWYDEKYYQHSPLEDPPGSASAEKQVLRGGSWDDRPRNVSASRRNWMFVGLTPISPSTGFRCGGDIASH
jgi:serine/threonine-protein kinase